MNRFDQRWSQTDNKELEEIYEPLTWVDSLRDACVKACCIVCITGILWGLSVFLLTLGV